MTFNYQENILEHYHNPRHCGKLSDATHHCAGLNSSCGDKIAIDMIIADNRIAQIAFSGDGCAISQASASILVEYLHGASLDTLKKMDKDAMLELVEIPLSPARIKCGLLALETAQRALVEK